MKNRHLIGCGLVSVALAALTGCSSGDASWGIYDLKVSGMTNPKGIDELPRFEWKLKSERKGASQSAWQIEVKDVDGHIVWQSPLTKGEKPFAIVYDGDSLKSNQQYQWKVTSIDDAGTSAVDSAFFTTGLLDKQLWKAQWIETGVARKPLVSTGHQLEFTVNKSDELDPLKVLDPAIYFRKEFQLNKPIHRAMAYVTAHGIYNFYINGRQVSELFAPGFTSYHKFLEYQQYDVTTELQQGNNVLGAIVADGWWSGKIGMLGLGNEFGDRNGLLCQLMLEYEDGTSEVIASDGSFRWTDEGAYRYSDLYEGEYYDQEYEMKGWDLPGFDDSAWHSTIVASQYGYDNLRGTHAAPVRVIRTIKPKLLVTMKGERLLDFGENIVGRVVANMTGCKGQTVTMDYQEQLDQYGNFYRGMRGRFKNQTNHFHFAQDGLVKYAPAFTFEGFRYVKIDGLEEINPDDYYAEVLNTDMARTGDMHTSDQRLNQLVENIYRSQSGNMLSIPTDCPHREKMGWTADMQVFAPTATMNMDVQAFLSKWLIDMRCDQTAEGNIPDYVPDTPVASQHNIMPGASNDPVSGEKNASCGWADACVITPWRIYEAYGDPKVLTDNYEMMERWMNHVERLAPSGIWDNDQFHYGDWLTPNVPEQYKFHIPGMPDMELPLCPGNTQVATCMLAYTSGIMAQVCKVLGKDKEAAHYDQLNEKVRQAFEQKYVHADGTMDLEMQGQYVLALAQNMVSGEKRNLMAKHLVNLVHEQDSDHLNTGFLSTPFLMDVLTDANVEEARKVLFQDTKPSWLYEVKMGATTMWENWKLLSEDGSILSNQLAAVSFNHFAYGCVGDYLYRRIVGIDKATPAFETIVVNPVYLDELTEADGWHESPYGRIEVKWQREGSHVTLEVTVPPSCKADVHKGKEGVETVESGHYQFHFDL